MKEKHFLLLINVILNYRTDCAGGIIENNLTKMAGKQRKVSKIMQRINNVLFFLDFYIW